MSTDATTVPGRLRTQLSSNYKAGCLRTRGPYQVYGPSCLTINPGVYGHAVHIVYGPGGLKVIYRRRRLDCQTSLSFLFFRHRPVRSRRLTTAIVVADDEMMTMMTMATENDAAETAAAETTTADGVVARMTTSTRSWTTTSRR